MQLSSAGSADPDGSISKVQFFQGATLLGQAILSGIFIGALYGLEESDGRRVLDDLRAAVAPTPG